MSESELVGCHVCKGRKVLLGLGSMEITCEKCKGIGWIEKFSEKDEDEFLYAKDKQEYPEDFIDALKYKAALDQYGIDPNSSSGEVVPKFINNPEKKKAGRPKKNLEV